VPEKYRAGSILFFSAAAYPAQFALGDFVTQRLMYKFRYLLANEVVTDLEKLTDVGLAPYL